MAAYKPGSRAPIILVCTIACLTLLINVNWYFHSTGHSLLKKVRSDASVARILDVFNLPTTASADHYSNECFTNTSLVFDSRGNPCIDFEFAAKSQEIYALNTSEVTYVYCAIPKNGCTYHLGLMHRILGFDYENGRAVHFDKTRLEVSGNNLKRLMLDQEVPKYFVVRNPLERVLSAYLDKVEPRLPAEQKTAESFEKWVYSTLRPGMEHRSSMNVHWQPQIAMCGFGMRELWREFRWFKVENPEEYVDFLEEVLPERVLKDGWNGKANASFRDAVLGPRKRTGHTSERFFKYVRTLRLFDYLVACYELDIDGLGYKDEVREMRELLARQDFVVR